MYYFASIEEINYALGKIGIDFTTFTSFEKSITFICFNLYKIVVIAIAIYIIYRIVLKLLGLILSFKML